MSGGFRDGSRAIDAPPWEPTDVSLYGHGGFSDSRSMQAALLMKVNRDGGSPLRRGAELRSGLNRRGVIYEFVRGHPGTHVRGMAKELGIATGDMQYHLLWLERHGLVRTRRSGFYRFVFPTMAFGEAQEALLGVLSQETPREILLSLTQEPGMTQGDLARSLGHSQPTISWHMERLAQLGMVSRKRTPRGMAYELAADREDVVRFVESYHPEAWKRWSGRLQGVAAGAGLQGGERGSMQPVGLAPAAVVELIGKR
jgi:DNA-binding MarR family transcriptional regulator